jgi:hypothetical protein
MEISVISQNLLLYGVYIAAHFSKLTSTRYWNECVRRVLARNNRRAAAHTVCDGGGGQLSQRQEKPSLDTSLQSTIFCYRLLCVVGKENDFVILLLLLFLISEHATRVSLNTAQQ